MSATTGLYSSTTEKLTNFTVWFAKFNTWGGSVLVINLLFKLIELGQSSLSFQHGFYTNEGVRLLLALVEQNSAT